ncbi:Crp/Fnr family transcriptional regulator [Isobaculum melis]|uniref:cAMP-binding domain of CRP or a regulatory subunit of cAMP-dependent protein kinases n=1 Tax=Isobaculum melis TaxID=142588 RepID=A0A1H9SW31_9LACT|nr:Crp/Fnr family transcriptional regulator [Isobaculum melis]SER89115.1 cAMP-binding domain of CRP or a regulatory subunit of cAMP-dependent protein kinases [Isobaculum melis]
MDISHSKKANVEAIITFLKQVPSYEDYIQYRSIKKNTSLFRQESKKKTVFVMLTGYLAVEVHQEGEKNQITTFVTPADFVGIHAFSKEVHHDDGKEVIINALTDAEILVIDKEFLLTALSMHPTLNDILLGIIAEIFQRHYAIMNIVAKKPTERLKEALLFLGEELGEKKGENILLPTFLSQGILAKFCRTSQGNISKEFKRLQEEGFIKNSKKPLIFKNIR